MEIKVDTISPHNHVITPEGEVDMGSSGELRETLQKFITKEVKTIIISLEEVSFIDSSGIATIIEALKKIEQNKGRLLLVINTSKIWNVFKLARLDMVFKIYDSLENAKNAE